MPRTALTGSRIRERRQLLQIRQADLASQIGISASYLNLIEHNRRRIGGKLLTDISQALNVSRETLAEGVDRAELATLTTVAQRHDPNGTSVETAEAFTARFPEWATLISLQEAKLTALEKNVEALNDRLAHDPILAGAMHEVLSVVTAVRSTASILVNTPELDPNWLGRFHENIDQDSRRLAEAAEAMVGYFEAQQGATSNVMLPLEILDQLWTAAGHYFPTLERFGQTGVPALVDVLATDHPELAGFIETRLIQYAEDAEALPEAQFHESAAVVDHRPEALSSSAQGNWPRLLRRFAALSGREGTPEFGFACYDGGGALLSRRSIKGFTFPLGAALCPRWPLFDVLRQPGQPLQTTVTLPDGAHYDVWAVAHLTAAPSFEQSPGLQATLLLRAATEGLARSTKDVGVQCRLCARSACAQRREPSII